MTHASVAVREASRDDLPLLVDLWTELRDLTGHVEKMIPAPDEAALLAQLSGMTQDPDAVAMIATVDDQVAGMAVFTCSSYAPLFDQRVVHTHYLHVREGFRRRGVGKALLSSAVSFADRMGAEHVVATVLPQLRETHRFYARLGFGPVAVRRSVPVNVLRRRLVPVAPASVTDHLLARRRSVRRVRAAVARAAD